MGDYKNIKEMLGNWGINPDEYKKLTPSAQQEVSASMQEAENAFDRLKDKKSGLVNGKSEDEYNDYLNRLQQVQEKYGINDKPDGTSYSATEENQGDGMQPKMLSTDGIINHPLYDEWAANAKKNPPQLVYPNTRNYFQKQRDLR